MCRSVLSLGRATFTPVELGILRGLEWGKQGRRMVNRLSFQYTFYHNTAFYISNPDRCFLFSVFAARTRLPIPRERRGHNNRHTLV